MARLTIFLFFVAYFIVNDFVDSQASNLNVNIAIAASKKDGSTTKQPEGTTAKSFNDGQEFTKTIVDQKDFTKTEVDQKDFTKTVVDQRDFTRTLGDDSNLNVNLITRRMRRSLIEPRQANSNKSVITYVLGKRVNGE